MKSMPGTESGYLHAEYAASLSQFGVPRQLPRCSGWVLERAIPSTTLRDAMGCYPLFVCRDWTRLADDLADLADGLVCLSLVTDPFGEYDEALLQECFPDKVVPFKQHFCIDLTRPMEDYVQREHRRNARRALKRLQVERCSDVTACLEEWTRLYGCLIQRHGITGIQAFSPAAFARQFEVPGLVVFRASYQGTTVGMVLLYILDHIAYFHLSASGLLGYEMDASSALYWRAIEYCRDRGLKWLNLGTGAGVNAGSQNGLARYKRGWSTGIRTVYFCGRVFNREVYDQIVQTCGIQDRVYFPAYRAGEFR
jgi:hypothetical protein